MQAKRCPTHSKVQRTQCKDATDSTGTAMNDAATNAGDTATEAAGLKH